MNKKFNPYRIKTSDINEAIYNPHGKSNKRDVLEEEVEDKVLAFTLRGCHDELTDLNGNPDENRAYPLLWDTEEEYAEDRDEAYAKVSYTDGFPTYYARRGPGGALFNPLGIDGVTGATKKVLGERVYKFRKVSKRLFDLYMRFLSTKKTSFLHEANREV